MREEGVYKTFLVIQHQVGQQLILLRTPLVYPCFVCCLVAKSCLTLCGPMDCSPPGSSVQGTLQARILEWVAMPFSGGSSQPRDQTQVSSTAGRALLYFIILYCLSTKEAVNLMINGEVQLGNTNSLISQERTNNEEFKKEIFFK